MLKAQSCCCKRYLFTDKLFKRDRFENSFTVQTWMQMELSAQNCCSIPNGWLHNKTQMVPEKQAIHPTQHAVAHCTACEWDFTQKEHQCAEGIPRPSEAAQKLQNRAPNTKT